ncbi:MAG TPA: TorF family putative porin [Holophagaceae bacterium]|jgi:uncharacterized protein (TIGR02001 family)|nr:TorF family putative porin [Holophagaceae bacterium]
MRRVLRQGLTVGGAFMAMAAPAQEASATVPLHGYAELMSNYVGRGLAQSVGQPSVGVELELGRAEGIYADLDATSINWIDQLYPGDSVSVEVDGLLGYRHGFARDWFWKAGLLRLQFPGRYVQQSPPVAEPHTTEVFAYLAWKGFSGRLNYALTRAFGTPDSQGSWYLDLNATQPVGAWTLGVHLGRKQARGVNPDSGLPNNRFSYTDYKVSVERGLQPGLSLSLAETWTNADPAYYTLNGYAVGGHHLALILKSVF